MDRKYKKITLHYLHYCTLEGKVQKVQKVQGKKMTVQIFIQAAKMEEDFLSVQNYQKWFKNFDIFHKRHKGNKGARLQKNVRETMGLWDFKVS